MNPGRGLRKQRCSPCCHELAAFEAARRIVTGVVLTATTWLTDLLAGSSSRRTPSRTSECTAEKGRTHVRQPRHVTTAALLALTAALLLAIEVHFSRLGLVNLEPREAALVQIGGSTAVYWIFAPLFVEAGYWLTWAAAMYLVLGCLRPFLSVNLALAGTKRLGPTISSSLTCTAPMFGVGLGVLVLHEPLTWQLWAGVAGVVSAVAVLSLRDRDDSSPRRFPLWALGLPVAAAALRAVAQLITKFGLEVVPSPFFVGVVAFTVGFAIAFVTGGQGTALQRAVSTDGASWLLLAGATNAVAVLVLNYALSAGRLSVVSPLIACTPVFVLLLGWLVFRERELTARAAIAVALVVPSVTLIGFRF